MLEKKFYQCKHCKNLFGVINDAGVTPQCCGEPMQILKANTTDAAQEKHVPVIERDGTNVTIKVGSVAHPMGEDHYIEWILCAQGSKTERVALSPGDAPEATFVVDCPDSPVTAYEHCNLHGLWASSK